ncbi:Protein BOLA2 [Diplonema papillatum]|nr:Protein BOLA2 [Diplonema papillatum]
MVSAAELETKLKDKLNTTYCTVQAMDGCPDKYEAFIVSPAFEGLKLLQRQRLVNETLAEEMKQIHAFVFKKTQTPAQYEEWKGANPQ